MGLNLYTVKEKENSIEVEEYRVLKPSSPLRTAYLQRYSLNCDAEEVLFFEKKPLEAEEAISEASRLPRVEAEREEG